MNNKVKILFTIILLFCGMTSVWSAGPTPGLEQERSRQIREYHEQQKRLQEQQQRKEEEEDVIDETFKPEKKQIDGEGISFEVTKILTTPSEILSEVEIREILSPLEGKTITLQDIFDAVESINKLYKEKNQIAARAILPPQKVKDGTVTIKLIEGRVGTIKAEDNQSTNDEFITERITAKPGDLVQITQLEEDLFYFNTVNDIRLRGVLKPGEITGTTDYIIQAIEPPHQEFSPFFDNAGTKDIGRERIGFNYINRSLLGYRDQLTLGTSFAEGTKSAYTSYSIPVTRVGTRLGFSFDISRIDIVHGQLEPLNIDGDSSSYGLNVTHPFIVNKGLLLNGFGDIRFNKSTTDFDGVTLFKDKVRTFSLGFDAQSGNPIDSWYTRHYLTISDGDWGNVQGFFKYNTDLSWMHIFPNKQYLTLRGRGQWSDDELLPSVEQFQIGGVSTVRGYSEGYLIGDDGYFLSLEYNFNLPFIDSDQSENTFTERWRGFVFLDHGGAFPFKGNNQGVVKDDFLTSVGFGLNINLGEKLKGRLAVGVPLLQRDDGRDDSPRLHFYLELL